MKVMFCSDIHGSVRYADMLMDRFAAEQAERLFILGDLYYHGPRNPLSEQYSPASVSEILNRQADKVTAFCGNCDSEVDRTISLFEFVPDGIYDLCGLSVYCTHGHRYSADCLPKGVYDMFVCGHTHVGELLQYQGKIVANCGSVGMPKYDSPNSYLVLTDEYVALCDLVDGTRLRIIRF